MFVLGQAVVEMLLELNGYQLEVPVLGAAVLEVGDESNEESLVERLVRLVLLDIESALRVAGVVRLMGCLFCGLSLMCLLEDYDWLEFLVERPQYLLQSIDNLVVDEVLQLP